MSIWGSPPTWIFFRLNVNQAGGFYLFCRSGHYDHPLYRPNAGRRYTSTVTKIVMVALMVCVVIMTIQPMTLIRIFR
ncbi:Uncharacterised protein [Escherichia coli]|nr:hypothetical protein G725_02192 [Escherichia coli HVH 53 (4-0631051)]EQT64307.1 hypothetical protein G839_01641 [Escherichia coli HVH 187 (4-4471660)]ERA41586.1 hypothetical protein H000_01531 [Escherichia coli UMEA 3899-1]SPW67827.1 Uncharacterised protein [Escherichia coli]STG79803.1 Uncharacterised protein [Escherichia coli]